MNAFILLAACLGLGIFGTLVAVGIFYLLDWLTKDLTPLSKGIANGVYFVSMLFALGWLLLNALEG